MPDFASPLGVLIRPRDKYGSGEWQAQRTSNNVGRPHMGIDIMTYPGQPILAPVGVKIVRAAKPYADDDTLSGIVLETMDQIQIKILYCLPLSKPFGRFVPKGECVAIAQSLQDRYPGIGNHCHFEVWLHGERVDPTPYFMETA